jgi:putative oxidoreductase
MSIDIALLLIRAAVGLIVAAHGAQKLFGWFGGYGLGPTGSMMGAMMGLRPGVLWASLAGVSELGGGLALALGFLSPLGSVGVIAAMATATLLAHWPRFWVSDNGMELTVTNGLVALGIAIAGPGVYSVDAALGIALPQPASLIVGLAAALLGVVIATSTSAAARRQQAAQTDPQPLGQAA